MLYGLIIFSILVVLLALAMRKSSKRHVYYRKRAKKVFRKIPHGVENGGRAFSFLRRINPYVFEEMVLDGFEKKGFSVKRNKRYSGDGGIDGRVVYEGKEYLVQCKRYRSYINPQHVNDFAEVCRRRGKDGYFVHTGKTGKGSKEISYKTNVKIISGNKLLELLCLN